jgi:hypothetical protein
MLHGVELFFVKFILHFHALSVCLMHDARTMFMSHIVVGTAFKTTAGELPADQCPPAGYDSVMGEVT